MKTKLRTDAVLTIKEANKMSTGGKRILAKWLRDQANDLLKLGSNYSPRFRARYMHPA